MIEWTFKNLGECRKKENGMQKVPAIIMLHKLK